MNYDNKNITFDDVFKELKELYKNNLIDEDGYIKNLIEIQNKFKKTLSLIEYYPLLLNSKHPSWFTLLVGTEEQKKSIYKMYCDDLE